MDSASLKSFDSPPEIRGHVVSKAIVLLVPINIKMANERDRPMRDYIVFDPTTRDTGVVKSPINTAQFEFKPTMFQMLQTVG